MNCSTFRQQASLYVDRQLDAAANQEFLFHLNSCKGCFEYVDEIRQTAELLQRLGRALPPKNLANDIIAEVCAAQVTTIDQPGNLALWLRNFFFYNKPQYISYATGFIITCLLFTSVLYGFKPQFRFSPVIENHLSVYLEPDLAMIETLPSVQTSSAIVELLEQTSTGNDNQDLFMITDVSMEGRAKLVQLVDAPENPQLERNVANALKRASFKPGTKDGRPVNYRMMLFIQTVYVRG